MFNTPPSDGSRATQQETYLIFHSFMKLIHLKILAIVFAFAGIFSSCQKEAIAPPPETYQPNNPQEWKGFNGFGPKLEQALSHCVTDPAFAVELVRFTQERPTGDFEGLLSDFASRRLPKGKDIDQFIVEQAQGLFDANDLQTFLSNWPSTVIAVRGNPKTWLEGTYAAPVKFVPSDFDERSRSTTALVAGNGVQLDLSNNFTEAVVAIHLSERHDDQGRALQIPNSSPQAGRLGNQAMGETGVKPQVACAGAPSGCGIFPPSITAFTAQQQNGGILLNYSVSNFPASLCSYGVITIYRQNPNGSTSTFIRYADDLNSFYDNTGSPNVTYFYRMEVKTLYEQQVNNAILTFECQGGNNPQNASATYPGPGPTVDTYVGTNLSNSSIRYDWYPPAGIPISDYRIRRSGNSTWNVIAALGGTESSYFYSYPAADRGNLITTQIQYRAAGFWQGNFFDKSYASFRNPGMPLIYYGVGLGDVSNFDFGESPLFGAPEIRLTALQADASENTLVIENTFLPMSGCTRSISVSPFGFGNITFQVNNGDFYPSNAPNGYTILNQWNNDLSGTAIRLMTKETDINVPVITTSTNTTSVEGSFSSKYGYKKEENGNTTSTETGVSTAYKDASEVNIRYPVLDIEISDRTLYYHEPLIVPLGLDLYGANVVTDNCQNLADNL